MNDLVAITVAFGLAASSTAALAASHVAAPADASKMTRTQKGVALEKSLQERSTPMPLGSPPVSAESKATPKQAPLKGATRAQKVQAEKALQEKSTPMPLGSPPVSAESKATPKQAPLKGATTAQKVQAEKALQKASTP